MFSRGSGFVVCWVCGRGGIGTWRSKVVVVTGCGVARSSQFSVLAGGFELLGGLAKVG
jgi:hypothetical protein